MKVVHRAIKYKVKGKKETSSDSGFGSSCPPSSLSSASSSSCSSGDEEDVVMDGFGFGCTYGYGCDGRGVQGRRRSCGGEQFWDLDL